MHLSFTILFLFALASISLAVGISFLLRINSCFFKAKLNFILFVFIQSLNIFYVFAWYTGLFTVFPKAFYLNHVFQLLTPVLIYLFSYFLIYPKQKLVRYAYWLFVPAGMAIVAVLWYATVSGGAINQNAMQWPQSGSVLFWLVPLKFINGIGFIGLSLYELHKHEKKLFDFYATLENTRHRWLRNALVAFLIIWALVLVLRWQLPFGQASQLIAFLVGIMNVYLLHYFSIYVQPLQEQSENNEVQLALVEQDKSRVNDSLLAQYKAFKGDFLDKINTEKPYVNPQCNLHELAKSLDVKPAIITGLLNHVLHTNFYEFISKKRAQEAAELLLDPSKKYLTIDAIAAECGFNSKATFYKAFKSSYGQTPAQYQKNHFIKG